MNVPQGGAACGDADLRALRAALTVAGVSAGRMWVDYLSMGGELSRAAFVDALAGRRALPHREYERCVAALNDEFIGRGWDYRVDPDGDQA